MMRSPVYRTKKAPAFCITWRGSLEGLVRIHDYYLKAVLVRSVRRIVTNVSHIRVENYQSCGMMFQDVTMQNNLLTFTLTEQL